MAQHRKPAPPASAPPAAVPRARVTHAAKRPMPPGARATIIAAHAAGQSMTKIAQSEGVPPGAVKAVLRAADPHEIDRARANHLGWLWLIAIPRLRELLGEALQTGKIPPLVLNVLHGTLLDKARDLAGLPSIIIGYTPETAGNLDRLCENIVAERERRRALEAETITVAPIEGGTR